MKTLSNLLALAALAAAGARAGDITITLDDPTQTGNPGDTLSFFGTITNDSADTIYLNSDDINLSLPDATEIDNFFASVPASLTGGQSSGDIDLFDVELANPEADPFGTYSGTYGLLGGADGGAGTAQDNLEQVSFSVGVEPAVTSAPEPSVLFELGTLLALLAVSRRLLYPRL